MSISLNVVFVAVLHLFDSSCTSTASMLGVQFKQKKSEILKFWMMKQKQNILKRLFEETYFAIEHGIQIKLKVKIVLKLHSAVKCEQLHRCLHLRLTFIKNVIFFLK